MYPGSKWSSSKPRTGLFLKKENRI
jgi:hypothetical protein